MTQQETIREYETIYITRANSTPADAEKIASKASEVITRLNGKVVQLSNLSRKRLAHPIAKASHGYLIHLRYVGPTAIVSELERTLGLIDNVVRTQTIRLRDNVRMEDVKVDPEAIRFREVEISQDDHEPSIEERLGLVSNRRPMDEEKEILEEAVP